MEFTLRRGKARLVRPANIIGLFTLAALTSLQSAAPPAQTSLAVAGRANANVSLVADGSFVAAAWSGSTADGMTDIFASASRDGGVTFSAPVRVNSRPGDARVNGEQPPRLALATRAGNVPQIAVLWTAKSQGGTALLTARSSDGGKTFSPSSSVTGTEAVGNRGWEAIGADRKGAVHAVWLDHRRMAAPDASKTAAAHQHGAHAEAGTPRGGRSLTALPWRSNRICISTRSVMPTRRARSRRAFAIAARRRWLSAPTRHLSRVAARLSGQFPRHGVHAVTGRRP